MGEVILGNGGVVAKKCISFGTLNLSKDFLKYAGNALPLEFVEVTLLNLKKTLLLL